MKAWMSSNFDKFATELRPLINVRIEFLAHLSQRLMGELIGYPSSDVRRRPQFQTSPSPKPLARSKPNFMWSLLG